jgi:hypothetical protein
MTGAKRKAGAKAKTPHRPPISQPHRLQRYSDEHLDYEVKMFFTAVIALTDRRYDRAEFLRNIFVEAFASHLRNLIAFLYPDRYPAHRDDVVAHHFLPAPAAYAVWLNVRPALPASLRRAKVRADKELAHLTTRRIAGKRAQKVWPVNSIVSDLCPVLRTFVDAADPSRLGPVATVTIRRLSDGAAGRRVTSTSAAPTTTTMTTMSASIPAVADAAGTELTGL